MALNTISWVLIRDIVVKVLDVFQEYPKGSVSGRTNCRDLQYSSVWCCGGTVNLILVPTKPPYTSIGFESQIKDLRHSIRTNDEGFTQSRFIPGVLIPPLSLVSNLSWLRQNILDRTTFETMLDISKPSAYAQFLKRNFLALAIAKHKARIKRSMST